MIHSDLLFLEDWINLNITNVNYKYIDYLRSFKELKSVLEHKFYESKNGGRKYIGVVFINNGFNFFVPLHKGKSEEKNRKCVYYDKNGIRKIKRSKFDIYVTSKDQNGNESLEQVLKCAYMIPVDNNDIILYSIKNELNPKQRNNFQYLYHWLKKNKNAIISRCLKIYKKKEEKTKGILDLNDEDYFNCDYWLPFSFAEKKIK